MRRILIAVPAAALLTSGALLGGAPATAAPGTPAPPAATQIAVSKNRPVSAKHIRHYRLTKRELRQIARAQRWARTKKARSVIRCESGFDYKMIDGPYHGAWQFLNSTWRSSGGGRYARTADKAPKFAQNHIAWKLWRHSGWGPWSCA